MFNVFRNQQFKLYNFARNELIAHPERLIGIERYFTDLTTSLIESNKVSIWRDYDEASYLFPFWQNYPPSERGRMPIGDQYPWIEVGEHAIGRKISRLLSNYFEISDLGIPTGTDERVVLRSDIIHEHLKITDSIWLFIDIKSVGPRDDQDHAVMSHNQVSGNGLWEDINRGVENKIIQAVGQRSQHNFYCSLPPIYVTSSGTLLPVVTVIVKPVYKMLSTASDGGGGQPLSRINIATIPNGLLLTENPNYLITYPDLFFPGKDDKSKPPEKVRARISFSILRKIADWRFREINLDQTVTIEH
jgi:hypothetical protein